MRGKGSGLEHQVAPGPGLGRCSDRPGAAPVLPACTQGAAESRGLPCMVQQRTAPQVVTEPGAEGGEQFRFPREPDGVADIFLLAGRNPLGMARRRQPA